MFSSLRKFKTTSVSFPPRTSCEYKTFLRSFRSIRYWPLCEMQRLRLPRCVALVRQGHVSRTKSMKASEHRHGCTDAMATLDPYQAPDHTVLVRFLELLAARHQSYLLRVPRGESTHHVDLLESELNRVEELRLARNVNAPELTADYTLSQSFQIGLPSWSPIGVARQILVEREVLQLCVATMLTEVPCEIVVPERSTIAFNRTTRRSLVERTIVRRRFNLHKY